MRASMVLITNADAPSLLSLLLVSGHILLVTENWGFTPGFLVPGQAWLRSTLIHGYTLLFPSSHTAWSCPCLSTPSSPHHSGTINSWSIQWPLQHHCVLSHPAPMQAAHSGADHRHQGLMLEQKDNGGTGFPCYPSGEHSHENFH